MIRLSNLFLLCPNLLHSPQAPEILLLCALWKPCELRLQQQMAMQTLQDGFSPQYICQCLVIPKSIIGIASLFNQCAWWHDKGPACYLKIWIKDRVSTKDAFFLCVSLVFYLISWIWIKNPHAKAHVMPRCYARYIHCTCRVLYTTAQCLVQGSLVWNHHYACWALTSSLQYTIELWFKHE